MRVILAVTCILSALLAEGNALSCQHCSNTTAPTCTGPSKTCTSPADTCFSLLRESNDGDSTTILFLRSCGQSRCDKTSTLSNPYMTVRTSSTCCTTDNCTPATPQLPSPGGAQNGVICPSCITSSASCSTSETMKCTGAETKCIRYSEKATSGSKTISVAVHGCATPTFCDLGRISLSSQDITFTTDQACADSSTRLSRASFCQPSLGSF